MSEPRTDAEAAVEFLEWLRPGGPWPITVSDPDWKTGTPTYWANTAADVRALVAEHSGQNGMYYTVAAQQKGVDQKPKKADLVETCHLHVDLDPPKDFPPEQIDVWLDTKLAELREQAHSPAPSAIIRSGNGLHLIWKLDEPFFLGGAEERVVDIEERARALRIDFDADEGTHNVDRLLRLPGSVNLPNKKKRDAGRPARPTAIVELHPDRIYPLSAFRCAPADAPTKADGITRVPIPRGDVRPLDDIDELKQWGIGEDSRCRMLIVQGHNPEDFDGDRSKVVYAVCCELVRRKVPDGLIVGILTDAAWGISAHIRVQKNHIEYAWRQVERARQAVEAEGEPFETDKNGVPYPNQHNIRLAMSKMQVAVRHDLFADRALVAGLEACGPYLDDPALNRLWLEIDDRYRFRPTFDFFVRVVVDTARRSAFHPVRDFLDGLVWDGVPRIDGWLSAYGGADDTPYSRAVGSLMLVAAVRRVRQPGVKFDEMLVMESKQGTNKSSALRVLAARDEWFIDDLPLNAESKVVIERLSGRWIAEAAELKGMRKGEVEHLKGFLSRQQDTARMSYARLPVIAPRQCVIFGTTNSEQYLRDLTGNRRFWPVKVEGFDLTALRRDVDQLWAEAAVREATGASIRLDEGLWGAAESEQDARRIEDPFVVSIAEAIGEQNGKISSTAVWRILRIPKGMQTQDQNARLGDAMRELGFERKKLRFDGGPQEWAYVRGTGEERLHMIVVDDGRGDEPY
ncbi:MAG TPA: VapE domain-containing protein [Novosphingobium sp.]|nr:VapE domain-containing protein [Novosphingobium sp.]